MTEETKTNPPSHLKKGWQFVVRWSTRFGFLVGGLFLTYLLISLIGLLPVNNNFIPDPAGVEIFVFSGEFHSDIILPLQSGTQDWTTDFPSSDFQLDPYEATHVAIGWGERNFYLHTPTWSDLKISTAAKALLIPSDTVMHVEMTVRPEYGDRYRSVQVSQTQYESITAFVNQSFARDENGNVRQIENERYGNYDAFYEAHGKYHAFRTCNCWVGEAMRAGGIRVGRFTPLPKSVFLYLDSENE